MKRLEICCGMLVAVSALALPSQSQTLLLPPTGQVVAADLTGAPGDTVIWEISLTNTDDTDPVDWWMIDSVQSTYVSMGIAGEIPNGPDFFTDDLSDYFLNNFVANGTALSEGQDINVNSPGDPVNLAEFSISPTADSGTVSGQLLIEYDIYDGNPFDPNTPGNLVSSGNEFYVDTSVTVVRGTEPSLTPEPSTWMLMLSAAWLVLFTRKHTTFIRRVFRR